VELKLLKTILIWLSIFLLAGALPCLQLLQSAMNRAAQQTYNRASAASPALFSNVNQIYVRQRILLATHAQSSMPDPTRAEVLLQGLGSLREPEPLQSGKSEAGGREFRRLVDSSSGAAVLLVFEHGQWSNTAWLGQGISSPAPQFWASDLARHGQTVAVVLCIATMFRIIMRPVRRDQRALPRLMMALMLVAVLANLPRCRWQNFDSLVFTEPGLTLFLVPPVLLIWWSTAPVRSGRDLRFCRQCGYDLFKNRSGICPECGQVIPDFQQAFVTALRA